ncbi:MAG TPA: PP2C family protein-serine/threonine phosphatase, partial [Lacipirellulaceae bacterium]|nr:PP2C family protein-serine/threonine phosphatase [Lacipirellulaceae bacterium]
SVACQAAAAVENAQLHEAALKNRDLERDLELAHKVQQGFLPSQPPQVAGYDFFDFYEAANQVGGDYFDYIPLPGNRLAVVLADVSGKGTAAALLMAKLSAEARYSLVSEPTAAQAINRLNASFSRSGWEDRFVTLVLAMLDLDKNTVTIVNAGHMDPLLRHCDGKVEPIGTEEGGMPLGVDAECEYTQFTIPLHPGESITVFTDGFSEAMNAKGELYGIDRLQKRLGADVPGVSGLGPLILEDVKKFVGKWKQSDDMCLICFGRQ